MSKQDTVMIVDDEPMVLTALRSFLELETGYRVLTFLTAQQALDALAEEHVDVVVSDYMMPGMDGITFLCQVRETWPLTTRILLTGYADKENAIRAINEAGLYHYLQKPWDNEHLKLVIRNGIERSRMFTELSSRVAAIEDANRELNGFRQKLMQAFL